MELSNFFHYGVIEFVFPIDFINVERSIQLVDVIYMYINFPLIQGQKKNFLNLLCSLFSQET